MMLAFIADTKREWIRGSVLFVVGLILLVLFVRAVSHHDPPPHPEVNITPGMLVRRPGHGPEDDKVYVVLEGQKHWVTSPGWFAAHGYKWPEDQQVISAEALDAIPTGTPVQ